eukprot:c6612_g1_i1.p1 GENE.c6612_g1_i1~~c6612_g1_i1.p1  ORF type:complete len:275 (-),score=53.03 c6612_g1_i1:26-850(-)
MTSKAFFSLALIFHLSAASAIQPAIAEQQTVKVDTPVATNVEQPVTEVIALENQQNSCPAPQNTATCYVDGDYFKKSATSKCYKVTAGSFSQTVTYIDFPCNNEYLRPCGTGGTFCYKADSSYKTTSVEKSFTGTSALGTVSAYIRAFDVPGGDRALFASLKHADGSVIGLFFNSAAQSVTINNIRASGDTLLATVPVGAKEFFFNFGVKYSKLALSIMPYNSYIPIQSVPETIPWPTVSTGTGTYTFTLGPDLTMPNSAVSASFQAEKPKVYI